jgi:hypothetical protein
MRTLPFRRSSLLHPRRLEVPEDLPQGGVIRYATPREGSKQFSAIAAAGLVLTGVCFAFPNEAYAQVLGTAETYGVLAGTTVTNTGPSVINGNVGVSPGSAVVGFPPGIVLPPGTIHAGDANAQQAQTDLTTAYTVLQGLYASHARTGFAKRPLKRGV